MAKNNNSDYDMLDDKLTLAKSTVLELNWKKINKRYDLDKINRHFSAALIIEALIFCITLAFIPKTIVLLPMLAVFGIVDLYSLSVKSQVKDEIRRIDNNIISYDAIIVGLTKKLEEQKSLSEEKDNDTFVLAFKDTMNLLENMEEEETNIKSEPTGKIKKLEKK